MKKNKMMRVASLLLVAVLLSTSVISGTFAKYVSEGGAEDVARVAKWGVTITGAGTIYADTYKLADTVPGTAGQDAAELSVVSNTEAAAIKGLNGKDKVVAPGTENAEGLTITVAGVPEVDGVITMNVRDADGNDFDAATDDIYLKTGVYGLLVKVTGVTAASFGNNAYYTVSGTSATRATAFSDSAEYYVLQDRVDLTADYYPVRYKLNGEDVSTSLAESSLAKMISDGLKVNFKANTDLASGIDLDASTAGNQNSVNVTWEWAFENGTDAAAKRMYNGADTILGHLAAGFTTGNQIVVKLTGTDDASGAVLTAGTEYNITSGIQILVKAEQID